MRWAQKRDGSNTSIHPRLNRCGRRIANVIVNGIGDSAVAVNLLEVISHLLCKSSPLIVTIG